MSQKIANISLLVNDYDEAISFYTKKLGFDLIQDIKLSETKRWVLVKPKGEGNCHLLLAKADGEEQAKYIGNQTGGRVFLFLNTDDFWRDYNNMKDQGIQFNEKPREEPYGTVVVFQDLYGNLWDLIENK